ncbi:MAG TPA: VWA domain-containing protein [Terriglobales bacterium]|jgi:VWFA-related protein
MRSSSRFLPRAVLLAILTILLFATLTAQEFVTSRQFPSVAPEELGIVISRSVNEVNLAFTVTDKRGHFVSDLNADDFRVFDNHLPPQSLTLFQRQSDLPIRVALLIDASDSTKYRFKYEQRAATLFLKKMLRPGKDQALAVGFDSEVRLLNDFSDDVKELSKSIKQIESGGNTAFYDAMVFACGKLRNSPPGFRRALIVISDGVDTASKAALQDAELAAMLAEVTIFAFSTNDHQWNAHPDGDTTLSVLAESSGGRLLRARDENQLTGSFREVEKTLRNQYALAYQPAEFKADGSYRHVVISPIKRGLKVRCRKGYFARLDTTLAFPNRP